MFCCIAEQLIDFCGGQGVFQNAAKHNRDWTAVHKLLKDRLEHDTRPPCEFAQRSRYSQFMARSCHLQRAGPEAQPFQGHLLLRSAMSRAVETCAPFL